MKKSKNKIISPDNKLAKQEKLEIAVKAAIEKIPYIGSIISNAYFEVRNRKFMHRLESFCNQLGTELMYLKEKNVDKNFLQTDEFSDIIDEVFQRVLKVSNEERIRAYRNVLIGSIVITHPSYDEIEIFLTKLPLLSTAHFTILRYFQDNNINVCRYKDIKANYPDSGNIIIDLLNIGIFFRPLLGILGGEQLEYKGEPGPNEEINFTPFGKNFVDFILKKGKNNEATLRAKARGFGPLA